MRLDDGVECGAWRSSNGWQAATHVQYFRVDVRAHRGTAAASPEGFFATVVPNISTDTHITISLYRRPRLPDRELAGQARQPTPARRSSDC